MGRVGRILGQNWRTVVVICLPIILLVIPLLWTNTESKAPQGAYVMVLVSGFYMTECLPLAITSLIPVFIYPLLGILDTGDVTSLYLKDGNQFLLGGLIIALSFEYSNLHMRIAMKVITLVGSKTSQLLFGVMTVTMTLSMWMNNTSTTAMMIPICSAIVNEIRLKMIQFAEDPVGVENERGDSLLKIGPEAKESDKSVVEAQGDQPPQPPLPPDLIKFEDLSPEQIDMIERKSRKLKILFLIGTAYSAGIGGIGLIIGTASNLVAQDTLNKAISSRNPYKNREKCIAVLDLDFLTWFYFNVIPMLVMNYLTWLFLLSYFHGIPDWIKCWKKKDPVAQKEDKILEKSLTRAIKRKYIALGPMSLHEKLVVFFFVTIILLWIFRCPKLIPGWADVITGYLGYKKGGEYWLGENFRIGDATPTLLICILMTFIPRKSSHYKQWRHGGIGRGMLSPVLNFDYVLQKIPWGVFILLGGANALSEGNDKSGLNKWVGDYLGGPESFLNQLSPGGVLLIALVITACLTTVASNVACASILVPVFLELSFREGIHPFYLALSATTVCSFAFILPVSTPPNALVYDAGRMDPSDMAIPGIIVTIYCTLFEWFYTHFVAMYIWGFDDYKLNKGYCNLLNSTD